MKKILLGIVILITLFLLFVSGGCATTDRTYYKGQYNSFKRNMEELRSTVDWWLLDFDEDDPSNY